jgi:hypothetical protein
MAVAAQDGRSRKEISVDLERLSNVGLLGVIFIRLVVSPETAVKLANH